MSLELTSKVENEILQRAYAEGVTASELIDRLLHSNTGNTVVHSVDPANDASIALLKARIAAAPSEPEEIQKAEADLEEFMSNINAERKRTGARLVYPEA